jgi:transposase InsO family protein
MDRRTSVTSMIRPGSAGKTMAAELKRLRRKKGLKVRQMRCFKRTTDSHHGLPVAPNPLEQDFLPKRPNQEWAADISYV